MENEDDVTHTVEVAIRKSPSEDPIFTGTVTVQSGEKSEVTTIDGTEYVVEASLDSGTYEKLRLGGTPQSVVVRVGSDGTLTILTVGDE